jgi:hypothetical protein
MDDELTLEIQKLTSERDKLVDVLVDLDIQFRQASLAFMGAFDTPQMRQKMSDEYSEDARCRLRAFQESLHQAAVRCAKVAS